MKTVYRSRVDWWVWTVVLLCLAVSVFMAIDTYWVVTLLYTVLMFGLIIVGFFGVRYEIEGDMLTVYNLFRPYHMPISKIADVRYCRGYAATAGMSLTRLSIRFVDRSVLRSYMPLEISPKDRDSFVAQLLSINPEIKVIR